MVGVTLYVSITTEESGKFDQEQPVMQFLYGFSFLCAVLSFVLQELTGVLNCLLVYLSFSCTRT